MSKAFGGGADCNVEEFAGHESEPANEKMEKNIVLWYEFSTYGKTLCKITDQ